jgi:propionyl-CoA carboxylase beta chain
VTSAQPDLSTTAGKIADLRARYQEAVVDAEVAPRRSSTPRAR